MKNKNSLQFAAARQARFWGVAVGILVSVAVTWLWAHEGHAPLPTKGVDTSQLAKGRLIVSRDARRMLNVQTAEVELRAMAEKLLAYATLVAPWQQHAFVTTRLPGRITELRARAGDLVSAGQPLAQIQSLELENLQLEVINAQNDYDLSEKSLKQIEPLFKDGVVPEKELLTVRNKHQENLNALALARNKWFSLGLSQQDFDRLLGDGNPRLIRSLPILSPIKGVVIHTDLVVGKVVEPTEHLFELVNLSSVWVKIGVLEKDLYKIAIGQPVELSLAAYPDEVFSSTVQVKGLFLDPQTHLGTVWAELSNPADKEPRFLPGMHGQAHVVLPTAKKVTTVPATALITDGAERFVLVEEAVTDKASTFQKKNVVAGVQSGDFVQIDGDVFPGDRVVTQGSHQLAGFFVQGVLRLSNEAKKNIALRVEPVRPYVVEEIVEVDGMVDVPPHRRTVASSQLGGTLQKIRIDRGQAVKKGEILGEIASLELQNLQLELLKAHLQAELLKETLKRLRSIDQVVPQRQIWETESLFNATVYRRDSVRRKLEAVGLSSAAIEAILEQKKIVETLPLRAPIDGVVVHFDKVLGQVIKAEEPLLEIHDLSQVWVQGFLSERDLSKVKIGQAARVRLVADPSFLAEASVVRSGRTFGADNRTLSVWAELKDPPASVLQHNMLARLTLTLDEPTAALAVPKGAVVLEGLRAYVFVEKADGTFERRLVETGREDDRFVEIAHGLKMGENVAVRGTTHLQTAYASLR